jgi:hypothetical protein
MFYLTDRAVVPDFNNSSDGIQPAVNLVYKLSFYKSNDCDILDPFPSSTVYLVGIVARTVQFRGAVIIQ